jgi:F-type H+-transporting ATPase subunit b
MDALNSIGINIGYVLMQIAGIGVLLIVLYQFVYEPILRTLEERQAKIAKGLEDSRQAAIARDNADAEAKKILEQARAEAAKIRQEASSRGEEQRKEIVAQAEEEAQEIVAEARQDAEEERNRILSDLRNQVAAIAVAAANKLVGESLDEKRQRELITEFFAKAPASVAQATGEKAVVTSALPLTDEEKQQIRETLQADTVEFKVDPKILGGLIVRVGDRVVDDSVVNRMGALRQSLE